MLRLYPRLWRERYEGEMLALLEQHEITFLTLLDLLLGALDARFDPYYNTQRMIFDMEALNQLRRAQQKVFWVFPIFFIGFFGFIIDRVDAPWDVLRNSSIIVQWTFWLMALSGSLLFWGTLIIGALIAVPMARKAVTPPQPTRLAFIRQILPLLSLIVPVLGIFIVLHLGGPIWQGGWPFSGILILPLVIALALVGDTVDTLKLRIGLAAATLITLVMFIHVSAIIIFQATTNYSSPGSNWSIALVIGFLLMIVPTLIALRAVIGCLTFTTIKPTGV